MRYMLIQDDENPNSTTKLYAIYKDDINEFIGVIDENCNSIEPPVACSMIDGNPPLPPCLQQP